MTTDPAPAAALASHALAAAGDAIVTVDQHGQITSWNPAAEVLLAHRADQATGQTLTLIIPTAHRERHAAAFHAAILAGHLAHAGRPARVAATTSDGEVVALVMALGLLPSSGDDEAAGAVAVLRRPGVDPVAFV